MFEPREDTGEGIIVSITIMICAITMAAIIVTSVNKITDTIKEQRKEFIQQLHTEINP